MTFQEAPAIVHHEPLLRYYIPEDTVWKEPCHRYPPSSSNTIPDNDRSLQHLAPMEPQLQRSRHPLQLAQSVEVTAQQAIRGFQAMSSDPRRINTYQENHT